MTNRPCFRARQLAALGALIATMALSGCWNPFSPRIATGRGISTPPPSPDSPSGVLRLFEWCYNNRAAAEYRELFTDDYRFIFSLLDSAGQEFRTTPWTREDELISTTQLFVGGSADQAPASSIVLQLDNSFFVFPDSRYIQWDPKGRWHKRVNTRVVLNIRTTDGNAIDIQGEARFYLVRGDSALIPEELRLRGFGPDSNRWYIQRWDDETVGPGSGGFAARPAGLTAARAAMPAALSDEPFVASWGYVKAYYRHLAAAATLGAPRGSPTR